jgi:hypothetical protein
MLAMAAPALAGDEELLVLTADRDAVVQSLLTKLSGCDPAVSRNAAYLLGEGKCTEAVIPLMRMLHDGEEQCRVIAALALARIGDGRGTYAVRQTARFDASPRVRTLAAWYYEQYVKPGTFAFVASGAPASGGYAGRE